MSTLPTITAQQGDTLDGLVWRKRALGPADLPAVLDLNPGLAAAGPILPAGQVVIVPAASAATPKLEIIQLWD